MCSINVMSVVQVRGDDIAGERRTGPLDLVVLLHTAADVRRRIRVQVSQADLQINDNHRLGEPGNSGAQQLREVAWRMSAVGTEAKSTLSGVLCRKP